MGTQRRQRCGTKKGGRRGSSGTHTRGEQCRAPATAVFERVSGNEGWDPAVVIVAVERMVAAGGT